MKKILTFGTGILLMLAGTATANPLIVSTGGTYASGTPTSSWTGAGDTWTVTFDVNVNPTIRTSAAGEYFDVPFTNFVYTLNGSPVSVGPVEIDFFNSVSDGLLSLGFFGSSVATLGNPANAS